MPSRNRYREAKGRSWEQLSGGLGVRERLLKETPAVVETLDFLAGQMKPYPDGWGWSAFNDWLDLAYKRHYQKRPESITLVSIEKIREAVFPASRV